jgi:hypothetical protein
MFAERGVATPRVPILGMNLILTLTRDQVRAGYRERGFFDLKPDGNLTGADRERLRATLNALRDKGKIGMTRSLVWLL